MGNCIMTLGELFWCYLTFPLAFITVKPESNYNFAMKLYLQIIKRAVGLEIVAR